MAPKHPKRNAIAKAATKRIVQKVVRVERKLERKKPSIGRSLMTGAGRFLGGLVGAGDIGAAAGNSFAHFLGMGAYTVSQNSIMTNSQQAPIFDGDDGSIVLSHSEFISDVLGSTAFTSKAFMIDPTNTSTFPYLSGVAKNFEQYEFLGLVFTYKPTSGSAIASTNNALGTVILTTEYDVSRPLFGNKLDMEAYQFCTSSEPAAVMYHPVECNPKKDILNARYVVGPLRTQRASTNLTGTNGLSIQNNLNYVGRTQLATVGMQAATTVGELWVSYKIKFKTPRFPGISIYQGDLHAVNNLTIPVGAATAYGTSYNIVSDSTSTLSASAISVSGTDTRISTTGLPLGTKIIVSLYVSSVGGTISSAAITNSNLTVTGFWRTNAAGAGDIEIFSAPSGQPKFFYQSCFIVNDNTVDSYVSLPAPTIATTAATWDIWVSVVPQIIANGSAPFILTSAEVEQDRDARMQLLSDQLESLQYRQYLSSNEEKESSIRPLNVQISSSASTPMETNGWSLMRR